MKNLRMYAEPFKNPAKRREILMLITNISFICSCFFESITTLALWLTFKSIIAH
jgi:hypothetical protein